MFAGLFAKMKKIPGNFPRLYLRGLPLVFFPLLFLGISMLPDELELKVRTSQYMEFYAVVQQKYIHTVGTAPVSPAKMSGK